MSGDRPAAGHLRLDAMEGEIWALRCATCKLRCGTSATGTCVACGGPLEVAYDYARIRRAVTADSVVAGPWSLWRYGALLPARSGAEEDLGVGMSPLVRADRLGRSLGLRELWIKNEGLNPTNSVADRGVAVAVRVAVASGATAIACASDGNLTDAVSAQAAHAGLRSYVFVPSEFSTAMAAMFGARVVRVRGDLGDARRLAAEVAVAFAGWSCLHTTLRPFYVEGWKTLAFETVEQLGWRAPDQAVAADVDEGLLSGMRKGFHELYEVGLLSDRPGVRVSGANAPAPDDEIVDGVRRLAAEEGVFSDAAGGVALAALRRLMESGSIGRDDCVVLYVTGAGVKTLDAVRADTPGHVIQPNLRSFLETLGVEIPVAAM
jgi:threonine synthase